MGGCSACGVPNRGHKTKRKTKRTAKPSEKQNLNCPLLSHPLPRYLYRLPAGGGTLFNEDGKEEDKLKGRSKTRKERRAPFFVFVGRRASFARARVGV